MPISREQFDQDLQAHIDGDNQYITAVDNFIGLQQIIDLAAEDAIVNQGLQAINDAKNRIPTPPTPKAYSAAEDPAPSIRINNPERKDPNALSTIDPNVQVQ